MDHWPAKATLAATTVLLSGLALAQPDETEPPDSSPPTVRPEGGVIEPTVIAPTTTPTATGARAGDPILPDGLPSGPLLREGTFLVRRSGALVRASTGEWVIAFQPGPEGVGLPPMVLLPCAETERIESEAEGVDGPVAIEVTGEVYAYASRNYLLPTMSRLALVEELAGRTSAGPTEPDEEAGEEPDEPESFADPIPDRPADDPRVLELLGELERGHATTPRRGVSRRDAQREAQPATAPAQADGRLIVRKRGRLVRLGSGQWAFASDTGFAGAEPGPIPLLPSSTLAAIESAASWSGEALSIEVSGRLFQYRGRTLMLPTAYVLVRASDLNPLR
ncbi:MAG: hypothetical protein JJU33_01605 [Phycisphaerales bacterium]|nr:hypothetical protein [Phycisphaerales bacterium]